jgi:chloride channel protein, CIC family
VNSIQNEDLSDSPYDIFRILLVATFAGVLVGIVGGAFRTSLNFIAIQFHAFITYLHTVDSGWLIPGFLVTALITSICVGISRMMVKLEPTTIGSGIQHVEAVMHGDAKPSRLIALPIKFFGGLLSIGSGMALGREGPTVQMAAVIGSQCGKLFRLKTVEQSLLYTAVAGAGLSIAFNAPLSGIAFSFEEISKKITIKRLVVSFAAVTSGMLVFRSYFGNSIEFVVGDLLPDSALTLCFYIVFSVVLSFIAGLYGKTIIGALNTADSFNNVSPVIKASIIGFGVGSLAYFYPNLVGGGDPQVQSLLSGDYFLFPLILIMLMRFFLGPICYSSGVPGGIFSPILLMGSGMGVIFVLLLNPVLGNIGIGQLDPIAFALVGMAAFFTVVVRAPLTGILLVTEMSGKVSLMIPLLIASVICTLIPALLKQEPIYDALRHRGT